MNSDREFALVPLSLDEAEMQIDKIHKSDSRAMLLGDDMWELLDEEDDDGGTTMRNTGEKRLLWIWEGKKLE